MYKNCVEIEVVQLKKLILTFLIIFTICLITGCEQADLKSIEFVDVTLEYSDMQRNTVKQDTQNLSVNNIQNAQQINISKCEKINDMSNFVDRRISEKDSIKICCEVYKNQQGEESEKSKDINFICQGGIKYNNSVFYVLRGYKISNKRIVTFGTYYVDADTGDMYEVLLTSDVLKPVYIV